MSDAAIKLTTNVLNGLPGQFLALVLLNTVFVLGLLWFLERADEHRLAFETQEMSVRGAAFKACIERR